MPIPAYDQNTTCGLHLDFLPLQDCIDWIALNPWDECGFYQADDRIDCYASKINNAPTQQPVLSIAETGELIGAVVLVWAIAASIRYVLTLMLPRG